MIGKNITIEQIGPVLILSDVIFYIIKELEENNVTNSVLIELEPNRKCPFLITHPLFDNNQKAIITAWNGIEKYIIKSNEDFKAI